MATLETNTSSKQVSGKKLHKKSTKVDLTPMVDLGFLLITFFVFTTAMTLPRAMKLIVPKDSVITEPIPKSKVLTLIPYSEDRIKYYEGELPVNGPLNETSNTVNGLRQVILDKKKRVQAQFGSDDMILVIKPANESSYKNFVDIMDEISINEIKVYFIDKLNAAEQKLLVQ